MQVGEGLCQIAAHTVLTTFERVDGEERDVLECHGVLSLQEDAQLGVLVGDGRRQRDGVFLPIGRSQGKFLLDKLLPLVHRTLIDELDADGGTLGVKCFRPDGEAVLLALLNADAEVALVDQSRAAVMMIGGREHYVVGATLERAVAFDLHASDGLPAHQRLRKLERAVLDQLAV